ncbi:hypothetical protein BC833DRAFT_588737 [Globomyces pollinis-pini]|nr:hypothetical protein BC833DRAFT_588737 [Globomyces pollinis-pini]
MANAQQVVYPVVFMAECIVSMLGYDIWSLIIPHLTLKDFHHLKRSSTFFVNGLIPALTWESISNSLLETPLLNPSHSSSIVKSIDQHCTVTFSSINDSNMIQLYNLHAYETIYKFLSWNQNSVSMATLRKLWCRVCYDGKEKILQILLNNWAVDPTLNNNYGIRYAAFNGHIECVRLLLNNDKVDPTVSFNFALLAATTNGHTECSRLLLLDSRIKEIIGSSEEFDCS